MSLVWLWLLLAMAVGVSVLYIIKQTNEDSIKLSNDRILIFIVKDGAEWIEGLARTLCSPMFLEHYGPYTVMLADNYSDDETHAIMQKLARELETVECVSVAQALECLSVAEPKREFYYFELESQTNFLKLVNGLRLVLEGSKSFDDVSASLLNRNGGVVACWAERDFKRGG